MRATKNWKVVASICDTSMDPYQKTSAVTKIEPETKHTKDLTKQRSLNIALEVPPSFAVQGKAVRFSSQGSDGTDGTRCFTSQLCGFCMSIFVYLIFQNYDTL